MTMSKTVANQRPWTVDGAAASYDTSVKDATKRIARETKSAVFERANNARRIAESGRALAEEYFGTRCSPQSK